jgi:glycosyltransferase involved in cell wall biosynthesis
VINNRLVFIIPFRNVKDYISQCSNTLISQNYKNWIGIFCDDASTDETSQNIPSDNRFQIRKNIERVTALPNIHNGIVESNLDDEDIICILDGDDFLIRADANDIINNLYQDETLLTYGQYMWPNGTIGHCKPYTEQEFKNLRKGGYWASHIRTFKYKLYKELIKQDPELNCYKNKNGEFYTITYDVAIMTPLMEIAGFKRVKFNPNPVYYYRLHQQNDHFVDPTLQKSVADEIFAKKSFRTHEDWSFINSDK